jgi:hypothetical protein
MKRKRGTVVPVTTDPTDPSEDGATKHGRLIGLLSNVLAVPKSEVDKAERQEQRNKARRKTPKPSARHGDIVPRGRIEGLT